MELVQFSFATQRKDFNVESTKAMLTASMCGALRTCCRPEELCFVRCEEDALNWFNLTFEIPNRSELLDILRNDALKKEPWLNLCGVKAVMIGDESQIVLQPITPSASMKDVSSPGELCGLITVKKCQKITTKCNIEGFYQKGVKLNMYNLCL